MHVDKIISKEAADGLKIFWDDGPMGALTFKTVIDWFAFRNVDFSWFEEDGGETVAEVSVGSKLIDTVVGRTWESAMNDAIITLEDYVNACMSD